jgi:hypothetical protein
MMRWQFHDLAVGDDYTVEYNPNTMSTPHAPRQTNRSPRHLDGAVRAVRPPTQAAEWTFGGFIRTQAHFEALADWAGRGNLTELTDHLNRVWLVRFVQFDEQEKRPTAQSAWRFTYQIKALVYGRLS